MLRRSKQGFCWASCIAVHTKSHAAHAHYFAHIELKTPVQHQINSAFRHVVGLHRRCAKAHVVNLHSLRRLELYIFCF